MKSLSGDIKYLIRILRIIISNRRFFFNFYYKHHLPETLARLAAAGKRNELQECLNEAVATKNNLLESIKEAIIQAEGTMQNRFVGKFASWTLRRESRKYSAIKIPSPFLKRTGLRTWRAGSQARG